MMDSSVGGASAVRPTPPAAGAQRVLQRVAEALNSTLDLREVLRLLAEITLEHSGGASRCTLFLLDDDAVFTPAVALGVRADENLWRTFREMPPVRMDAEQERLFRRFRAVPIEDAKANPLIPKDWVERFDLHALVIVPLLAMGEPCGSLVVDFPAVRTFEPAELALLEAIGQSAGVAVRNARLYEVERRRARLQEALARGAAALSRPVEPTVIAGRLAAAYTDLLGAGCCAIGRVDYERRVVMPIIVSGYHDPPPMPFTQFPEHLRQQVAQTWDRGNPVPLEFGDETAFARLAGCGAAGAVRYLLVPMMAQERPIGVVLLGFPPGVRLDDDAREAAQTLANIAAAALERQDLLGRLERQLRHSDVLYRLSTALTEQADARALVAKLNELLADPRMTVEGMALRDQQMARRLGGDKLLPAERAVRSADGPVRLDEDLLSVPMRLGRRLVGHLRVGTGPLHATDEAFVVALASGVAEVASRGALRAALDAAARDRAVAAERDRMAADLHDTVGQLFVAIGLMSRRQMEQVDDEAVSERIRRLAELADGGKWELEQAIRALAFVPAQRRGLAPALRALAHSFEHDSGISVLLESIGRPVRLSPAIERALYRVANEALTNAWRHARCSFVRMELEFTKQDVALRIVDDGVGLGPRLRDRGPGLGIMSMRRAVAEVDGALHVRNQARHGVRVEARVPRS